MKFPYVDNIDQFFIADGHFSTYSNTGLCLSIKNIEICSDFRKLIKSLHEESVALIRHFIGTTERLLATVSSFG